MRQPFFTVTVLLCLCLFILGPFPHVNPVRAGGPLIVSKGATSYVWDTSRPVTFNLDRGGLGILSHEQAAAFCRSLFQIWQDVPTARIEFQQSDDLPKDINGSNIMEFLNTLPVGVNPIIFDVDGSVIEALAGGGARFLAPGAATPVIGDPETGTILQSLAVLNGLFIDGQNEVVVNPEIPLSLYRATFVHEFGHFFGLDHTALNTDETFDGDSSNDEAIPTMFPLLASDKQATLHLDDIVAVSTLYPTPEFLATRSVIRGHVTWPDGTGFQGINVTARSVDDPFQTAVSCVSGFLHSGSKRGAEFGSDDPALLGYYELPGLPPGTYTVDLSPIDAQFSGGSSVGPVSPPPPFPGRQFFVGPGQPGGPSYSGALRLTVPQSSTTEGIDIKVGGRILSVAHVQGQPGMFVDIPVLLSDPNQIGTVVFSFSFDFNILASDSISLIRGPLIPAGFSVSTLKIGENLLLLTISPPVTNLRASLNTTPGALLIVRARISPDAQPGKVGPLTLGNVFAVRSAGDRISLLTQQGSVTVTSF